MLGSLLAWLAFPSARDACEFCGWFRLDWLMGGFCPARGLVCSRADLAFGFACLACGLPCSAGLHSGSPSWPDSRWFDSSLRCLRVFATSSEDASLLPEFRRAVSGGCLYSSMIGICSQYIFRAHSSHHPYSALPASGHSTCSTYCSYCRLLV